MWLREMKRFFRNKSRIIGSLGVPFFFLSILGTGFSSAFSFPGIPENVNYIQFLAPGIIGMVMLFASMFGGLSVLKSVRTVKSRSPARRRSTAVKAFAPCGVWISTGTRIFRSWKNSGVKFLAPLVF